MAVEERLLRLGREVLPRGVEVEAELVAERPHQPAEVVGDVRHAPRLDRALAEGRAAGRGRPARGRPPSGCRGRGSRGRRRTGELNENDRGSSSSVSMAWSLGHAIFSLNRSSRSGSLAGRSTKSKTTRPPARLSAVSTESVSRRLDGRLDREPVDDDLDGVLLLLVELRWVVQRCGSSPSTRARLKPWVCSCRNSSTYSPLRPRITGASTWNRRPSSSGEHPVDDLLRASAARSARRRSGSAAGRRGRRAGGGSRRPR